MAGGWLDPGAVVVLEEAAKTGIAPTGLAELDRRTYGDTQVCIYRA